MQRSDATGNDHTALQALCQVGCPNNWAKAIKRRHLVATSPTPLLGGETRLAGDIAYFAACMEISKATIYLHAIWK
jgi:hypothetical protein